MTRTETFARTVAALLPGVWRFNTLKSKIDGACWRESIVIQSDDDKSRAIHLCDDWRDDQRWSVTGDHGNHRHSITVAKSRTARAICRDIERRFLADYLTAHADWKDRQATNIEGQEAYKIKRDLIMKTFPDAWEYGNSRFSGQKKIQAAGGSMETYLGDDWKLEISLDFNMLIRVLCLINSEKVATNDT